MNRKEIIAGEAAGFVVDGEETDPKDEQQLVTWLSESPQHAGEYVRMSALWEVLADPQLDLETRRDGVRTRARTWWAAAAAVIILAAGAGWWATTRPATFSTTVGEVTSFALADRSVVFLNADSRLSVSYSEAQRRVVLHSGEAVFEVASDPERPFVVVCGTTRVTAVGTKFAVGLRSGQTSVTLIEGKVVVADAAPALPRVSLEPGQRLLRLDPGRGRTKTGQLWAYARDDRPWAGPQSGSGPPCVAYVYAPDRRHERPAAHRRCVEQAHQLERQERPLARRHHFVRRRAEAGAHARPQQRRSGRGRPAQISKWFSLIALRKPDALPAGVRRELEGRIGDDVAVTFAETGAQRFSVAGSFCTRFAFIANVVCGRLRVFL